MAPKRKAAGEKKGSAGKKVKKGDSGNDGADDLVRAKLARKHGGEPAYKAPEKTEPEHEEAASKVKPRYVEINRAPVLTAWVAAVAEQEGYSHSAGLTFGKAIAAMFAQSKGRSIGVYEAKEKTEEEKEAKRSHEEELGIEHVDVFGVKLKALKVQGELRALEAGSDKAVDPKKVQQYLERAFKDRLDDVNAALTELAESYPKEEIGHEAYHLYEQFRPSVPQGKPGWGRKGHLELDRLLELKKVKDEA